MIPTSTKSLVLIAMGLYLYSRFFGGTLLFYINERFVILTLFAAVGFIIVGLSYRYRLPNAHEGHEHGNLSWAGLAIVVTPIVLGLVIPPKPLGAAAMSNRDVRLESLTSAPAPSNDVVLSKPKGERNILDWQMDFWSSPDPTVFNGQEAKVIGFVYRDDRFKANEFMVSRFTISCCAADAAPIGLMVRSDEAKLFPTDQWVEVKGNFQAGQFDGKEMPILIADLLAPTDIPNQPYLYPY